MFNAPKGSSLFRNYFADIAKMLIMGLHKQTPESTKLPHYRAKAKELAALWGVHRLADRARIELSARLQTSLARSYPKDGLIRLNGVLLSPSNCGLVAEVLCHELAHLAVYELFGPGRKPHGPEWQALVEKAGFSPRLHIRLPAGQRQPTTRVRQDRVLEHRCPVCQTVRFAVRHVPQWRCAECLAAGLEGKLVTTRHPVN